MYSQNDYNMVGEERVKELREAKESKQLFKSYYNYFAFYIDFDSCNKREMGMAELGEKGKWDAKNDI